MELGIEELRKLSKNIKDSNLLKGNCRMTIGSYASNYIISPNPMEEEMTLWCNRFEWRL
jgi:hypothetical protein